MNDAKGYVDRTESFDDFLDADGLLRKPRRLP